MLVQTMSPWFAKALIAAAALALVAIPASLHRGPGGKVTRSRKRLAEKLLLGFISLNFLCTLIWLATPLLRFADYPSRPAAFISGAAFLLLGLWLLYRSHADLGTNWSVTLEVREGHQLITRGVYRHVRHPMYLALVLYGLGQALALPNWVAGPAYLVGTLCLVAFRIGPEERMMTEVFGASYEGYRARTRRLVPGLW
jgi:protein-S-isoprenylcysteine O-methyltransferase Ste14